MQLKIQFGESRKSNFQFPYNHQIENSPCNYILYNYNFFSIKETENYQLPFLMWSTGIYPIKIKRFQAAFNTSNMVFPIPQHFKHQKRT